MRKLYEVIDNMIELVPNHEVGFLAELEDLRSSVVVCAPENQGMWWAEVAIALGDMLGEDRPTEGWQFEVWKEWMGPTWESFIDA